MPKAKRREGILQLLSFNFALSTKERRSSSMYTPQHTWSTSLQPPGSLISTGVDTQSVAMGDFNRNGNSHLAMSCWPRVLTIRPTEESAKSVPLSRDATQTRVYSRQTGGTTMKTKMQQRGCLVMMTTLRTLPAVAL